jgi:uncharacterized protein (TIGR02996 family)
MPSRKKPAAKTKPVAHPPAASRATRKPTPRKATPKPAGKKQAAKLAPAVSVGFTPTPEQAFRNTIHKLPDDLTAHLAYADWLTEHGQPTRAAALRAWVDFVRVRVAPGEMEEVREVYLAYRHSLHEEDAAWIGSLDRLRKWIGKPLAEKMVRIQLTELHGMDAAVAWTVDVTRCVFDNRWHGSYRGDTQADGKTVRHSGAFFVDQIFGSVSGHVTSV